MTTNQHYLVSGERPTVKWARQVDMDVVDRDDMCSDGRYGHLFLSLHAHTCALSQLFRLSVYSGVLDYMSPSRFASRFCRYRRDIAFVKGWT